MPVNPAARESQPIVLVENASSSARPSIERLSINPLDQGVVNNLFSWVRKMEKLMRVKLLHQSGSSPLMMRCGGNCTCLTNTTFSALYSLLRTTGPRTTPTTGRTMRIHRPVSLRSVCITEWLIPICYFDQLTMERYQTLPEAGVECFKFFNQGWSFCQLHQPNNIQFWRLWQGLPKVQAQSPGIQHWGDRVHLFQQGFSQRKSLDASIHTWHTWNRPRRSSAAILMIPSCRAAVNTWHWKL